MQVNLKEYSDTYLLHLLTKDLLKRDNDLRHKLILDQITEKILVKWIDYAHANKLFKKPTKCVVQFVERDDIAITRHSMLSRSVPPFTLTASLDHSYAETVDEYCTSVKNALVPMMSELREKYDLDKLEFDGEEAIKVYEFHDIMKGF